MTARKTTKVPALGDPFRATGAVLRANAEAGNEAAIAELARRKAKREQASA